ncbi:TauD/TfdA family dioxygenase [Streptomyces sp. NPDC021749]|uniref:TauD/TfdA dioxygenase family protein n=1 Tax=Streptomyces sp. NPDC021749 TaxID=3154905 RepID=UPI0033D0F2F3
MLRRTPDGWTDRPYERFEVVPQGATLGAEIRGLELSRPLAAGLRVCGSAGLRAELNRALLEWKVLFFRGQVLTSESLREFAVNWGVLETNPLLAQGDTKEVVRFEKAAGAVPTFENVWHADVTFRERPALGAVLRLREVPASGGDTLWADMAAAYDNLPSEIRARIGGARAVHDYLPGFARFYSPAQLALFQAEFPPVGHPAMRRRPEPGRRTLFVNASFTTRIAGWAEAESDRMLRLLCQQAQVPEFQVWWRWQAGDVAFWDNRAAQHYAVNDYGTARRVAERVAIAGDRPY